MRLIRFFLFTALAASSLLANAQENGMQFKRCPAEILNFKQGLLNNETNEVVTDKLGFTWVSTRSGLQRFNGYTLENITPVIDHDSIRIHSHVYLFALKNGNIWISYRKGVLEYNPLSRLFRKIISLPLAENYFFSVVPLLETNEGVWCMQRDKGIVIYDQKTFKPGNISGDVSAINNTIHSDDLIIASIISTNENHIFIRLSSNRILKINADTHQLQIVNVSDHIFGLGCNNDHLFVTTSSQLLEMNINDDSITQRIPLDKMLSGEIQFSCIHLNTDHKLLISLNNQLFELDSNLSDVKELRTLNEDPIVPTGSVHRIYEDRFKRIWLLTNNDVRIVQDFEIPFQHFLYKNEASNYVRCMYYDKDENYLLAGCIHAGQGNNGGIQLYDTSGNPLWKNALFTDKVKNISNMEKLAKGKYLIMTSDQQGWFLLSLPEKKLQEFNWTASSQIRSQVYKTVWQNNVQRVNDSTLFIACSSNIYECIFRNTTLKSIAPVLPFNSDTSNVITCFIYTTDHTFWVGTNAGVIYHYKSNEKLQMAQVPGNYVVRCFAEDSMHRVYVGTDKGTFVYENSLKLSGQITMQSGLLNDYIYAMVPVGNSIFASSKRGLSFIASSGAIKNYTSELGLQEDEFNTESSMKIPSGKIFFGGVNGITAFYQNALKDVNDHPVLNITGLFINDSSYNFLPKVWPNDSIILKYDQNHLQFNFAALGFLNADEYIYKYRLKGFEENWQTTHQPNGIKYVLPPGNYLLELSCSPIFSSSSVFKKSIVIIVAPPWWQTWWFRISVIILSIGIIGFIVQQYNRRKYLKRIQAMQLQQNIQQERERISRDLHDNLGAYAAAIASNISVIKNSNSGNDESTMNQLKDNSQSIINQLNDTIWALNREAVLLTAISDRFKVFIQKIQSNYPALKISVEEKIVNDVKLSPTNALHLFRIMQEALNNAVRHSGCTNILVQIISDEEWKIIIKDDGRGLDISDEKIISGNGLRNMKLRGKEAGWKVNWAKANPHGTEVIISSTTN